MVELVDTSTNYNDRTKYTIKFLRGNKIMVTKEYFKSRNVRDTGYIPISSWDYI